MFNLLKADLLKLRWSKLPWITTLGIVIMYIIYVKAGSAAFVYSLDVPNSPIGFQSNYYRDINNPLFSEVATTALSFTAFFWLLILVFTLLFFAKEYSENTIKIMIAYGHNRLKIYLSKVLIILGYSFIAYYTFTLSIFTHASSTVGYQLKPGDLTKLLNIITLNYLAMVMFILISLLVCTYIKNIGITATIMCFYTFACAIGYMGEQANLISGLSSLPIKLFIKTNPMYYWMTFSAFNFKHGILQECFFYVLLGIPTLILLSCLYLRKQELK